jgi:hypothetical protein
LLLALGQRKDIGAFELRRVVKLEGRTATGAGRTGVLVIERRR